MALKDDIENLARLEGNFNERIEQKKATKYTKKEKRK